MEAEGSRRSRVGPISVAAVVLLLVAVVAAASRASFSRIGDAPPHIDSAPVVADVVVGILLVVAVAGAALLLLGLPRLRRRRKADDIHGRLFQVPPAPWYERLILALVPLALMTTLIVVLFSSSPRQLRLPRPPAALDQPPSEAFKSKGGRPVTVDWLPVLVGVGVALAAATAVALLVRARLRRGWAHRAPAETAQTELVEAIDESLDDLEREPDPRRAVIRAYSRMERTLGRHGLERRRPETPLEYLARALQGLRGSRASAERLTGLFEEAKFSPHPIDAQMKGEAIAALAALRAEVEQG